MLNGDFYSMLHAVLHITMKNYKILPKIRMLYCS